MANKFKVFGNSSTNLVDDSNWTEDITPSLKNGFLSGTVISSAITNTILRQNSLMTYALASVLDSYAGRTFAVSPNSNSSTVIDFVKTGLLGMIGFKGTYTADTVNGDKVQIECGEQDFTFNVTNAKNAANATNANTATKTDSIRTTSNIDPLNPSGLYLCTIYVTETPEAGTQLSFLHYIGNGDESTIIGDCSVATNQPVHGLFGSARYNSRTNKIVCKIGIYDSSGKCTSVKTINANVRKIALVF